jgi:hypothetical protein
MPDPCRHCYQRLDAMRNISVRDPKMAGVAFFPADDDPGAFELREMHARRRQRHARLGGKLSHGQRVARHECHDHVRARRIADQGRRGRNVGAVFHSLTVTKLCDPVNCWRDRRSTRLADAAGDAELQYGSARDFVFAGYRPL